MGMFKTILVIYASVFIISVQNVNAQDYGNPLNEKTSFSVQKDISYKSGANLDEYEKERCKLDLYIPEDKENFPIIVWFHSGGLSRFSKDEKTTKNAGAFFASHGIGVVIPNYRLSPKVKFPAYIQDAASSIAWVKKNIFKYGGNTNAMFLAGHSAGGYIVLLLGIDMNFLGYHGIGYDEISGIISLGGQTLTHYAVRKEMGLKNYKTTPVIDEAAPCFYAGNEIAPVLTICGDNDSFDRKIESLYFTFLLKKFNQSVARYIEVKDHTHWELVSKISDDEDLVSESILNFISELSNNN